MDHLPTYLPTYLPRRFGFLLVSLGLFTAFAFPLAAQGLAQRPLTRDGAWLRFSAATPLGQAAGVAAWVESQGLLSEVRLTHRALEVKASGEAAWSPGEGFPDEGFYLMADVATGAYGLYGWPLLDPTPDSGGLEAAAEGAELAIRGFRTVPTALVVAVIRPGKGVWVALSRDGAKDDRDGEENGQQILAASSFLPVTGASAFSGFATGDHVVVAELRSGIVFSTVISRR